MVWIREDKNSTPVENDEFQMDSVVNNARATSKQPSKSVRREVTCPNDLDENSAEYRAFQSRDLILKRNKDVEARKNDQSGPSDGHGTGPVHTTGYFETLTHHFKGNIGSGVFALGDAFKNAGLLLAPPLTIFLGFICVHAQHMLLNCNEEVSRRLGTESDETHGYAETVELCFSTGPLALRKYSKFMKKLVNIILCVTQFGFCSIYFMFISDNLGKVLESWFGFKLDLQYRLLIVLLPIMLCSTIRNLKFLVPLSSFANILIIFGYAATLFIVCQDLPPISKRNYVADWKMLPMYFGTAIYSFEGINMVLPLRNEMKNPRNFGKALGVLNVGMVIAGTMFIAMGFLAYLKYGDDIKGSVSLNLVLDNSPLPQCIQLAISVSILLTYPLQLYIPAAIMWPSVEDRFSPRDWPVASEVTFKLILCVFTFIMAEAIPHLELFISLVGAVSSSALALIFPPIIEMAVVSQNQKPSKVTIAKDIFILILGISGCITGTYVSIMKIVQKELGKPT